jgi:5-methylthioadenosine/S-adenosylhomocysteine deaminase
VRHSRYHQYDTYWSFEDLNQGWLRYREDEFLDDKGGVTGARARLTLTGATREDQFGSVLLSRSRYLAPALHSARFYREYFRPAREHIVEKNPRALADGLPRRRVLRPRRPSWSSLSATAGSSK